MKNAVCLISGGMDSSTLAYLAKDMGYDICALHFSYGQRTEEKERKCAEAIAVCLDAEEFIEIPLTHFSLFKGSSLTDHTIAVKTHENEDPGLPNTYVPFRNANLLSIATSYAEARGAEAIFIGVQASDYADTQTVVLSLSKRFRRSLISGLLIPHIYNSLPPM